MSFNIGKQLSDIRADVKVQSVDITPSVTCKSHPDSTAMFTRLLECLHMKLSCDLTFAVVEGNFSAECPWANHIHNWEAGTGLEALSYGPLVDYLKLTAQLNALAVSNGERLPNGRLFDMPVYSLKSDVRLHTKQLRVTADEPRFKFRISGRTDVVVIPPGSMYATRQTVSIAIEVKSVSGFKKKEALREAFLQLIGLNVANDINSPCVILTNLAKTHFVLYLDLVDHTKQQFNLALKHYNTFNQALWFAVTLKDRPSVTKHFGAAPTPQSSKADSEEDSEEELADEFDNVTLSKYSDN